MSAQLISRSADLRRLREEGYDISVRDGCLVVRDVPYRTEAGGVGRGVLVSPLELSGEVTTNPVGDHVVRFAGSAPFGADGRPLDKVINGPVQETHGGIEVQFLFSSKPPAGYVNYYEKMVTYINILSGPAQLIEPDATAMIFPVVQDDEESSVFNYTDTATGRVGITEISEKLRGGPIAIVGVGGTGSYVLDLVAKSPVQEIHLFDGDRFLQHNAFRSPGAPTIEQMAGGPLKVEHFTSIYRAMHRGIIPHGYFIDEANVDELREMGFVFVCADSATARELLIPKLDEFAIPFIDVGMGIHRQDGALAGLLRVTTSTPTQRGHVGKRIPTSAAGDDEYDHNIQIADLNALNAALAVMKWKKTRGFYVDTEREHNSTFMIDGSALINEDVA